MTKVPAPGVIRAHHPEGTKQGSTHGDGVAVIFQMNNIYEFSERARSGKQHMTSNGAPMPLTEIHRWLRFFNLGKEVRGTLMHLNSYMFTGYTQLAVNLQLRIFITGKIF
jgi:hypothetical protein